MTRLDEISSRQKGYRIRDTLSVALLAVGLTLAVTAVGNAFTDPAAPVAVAQLQK